MKARTEVTCWTVALALLVCVSAANADMVLSSWQYEASMVAAGHAFGSATVGGNIYTFGGNAPGADYGTNRVQRYNPAADTWTLMAPMPTSRHSLGAAAVDGYIYAIGGHVGNSLSTNERYDPSTNTWQSMASKPTAVSGPGVAAFGDKIYTFGGNHYGSMQSVIEVYDPATNSWASVGNMPVAGESWTAAVMGGKIYLAGGNFPSTGGYTTHLWSYDPMSGSWDTSLPSLSSRSMFHELVGVGNHLLAIGGCGVDGIPAHGILASVESWTPGASAWTMDTSLNTARFQFGAEAIGNTIYVFGGHSGVANLASTESANVVPVPAAAWLALIGMGFAGGQLRRRKML